ncbi:MAG: alpha beta-propellor repeat-containing integrin [Candidatus Magnetoglobus multicellularis str. Araruama]|uniref:Alpha beta-propellor repeat-containing integrin n=1 Tax=Candidatus Magnetoglobus multicellularis str. Araruama TaxID=890399 RepID=A0A1V1P2U0_9BACT|nr:MAG: alpha beta-propellor repeat-containing integrin [Candidatus Magnetoglobus multicellularis str. Araruama]
MINWLNIILLYTIIMSVSNLQLTWSSEIQLKPSNRDYNYRFGSSVSIYGKYAIVGAPLSDQNKLEYRGSAYIFEYDGEKWNKQKELLGFNRGDHYGHSVAISNNYALIGAPSEDINLSDVGSVYVYFRVEDDWIFHSKIIPNDVSKDSYFGSSVSIDDDFAIIGSPYNNIIGSAYIFKRINNSWIQQEKFSPSDSFELNQFSNFGRSVSISANHSIIGSQKAAYIFSFDDNKWNEHSKLSLGNTSAVAISENYAIVVKSGRSLAIHDAYIYELKKIFG